MAHVTTLIFITYQHAMHAQCDTACQFTLSVRPSVHHIVVLYLNEPQVIQLSGMGITLVS